MPKLSSPQDAFSFVFHPVLDMARPHLKKHSRLSTALSLLTAYIQNQTHTTLARPDPEPNAPILPCPTHSL